MSKRARVTARVLISALGKAGFVVVRSKGSTGACATLMAE